MSKPSLHALVWSHEREHYELHMHGQLQECFPRGDESAFSRWLEEHTAFAFVGKSGRLWSSKKRGLAGQAIGMPIVRRIDTLANAIWDPRPR